ncbi:MAG: 30S ribosomal protein S16 [bacterium]
MAAKIRLARKGKRNAPFYHIVVADGSKPRDGRFIEVLGTYDPTHKDRLFSGKKERIEYWLSKGAKPSETVSKLFRTL